MNTLSKTRIKQIAADFAVPVDAAEAIHAAICLIAAQREPMDQIECTYGDVLDAKESLGRLANSNLPTRVAYHVGRVLKYASDASKVYDLKRRALIRKYGEPREATMPELINGAKKVVHDVTDPAKAALYNEEVEPLRDEKIVLPWRPIPADALPATLTPGDAALLLPFLSGELPPLGD